MPEGTLDVAVVGAGHNGLVAAATSPAPGCGRGVRAARHRRRRLRDRGAVAGRARLPRRVHAVAAARARSSPSSSWPRTGSRCDVHEPYLFAPLPDGRKVVTWSIRERTRAQLERDWSRADADGYARVVASAGRRAAGARPPADARAARPRALARGRRAGDPRRADRRRAGRDPLGGGAGAVRAAGPDRHARRPRRPGHRVRRLLPRPRRGGRARRAPGATRAAAWAR